MDKFSKWLDDETPLGVSLMLNVSRTCVYNWRYGLRYPRPSVAQQIVSITHGQLTLEDIYKPTRYKVWKSQAKSATTGS
jgi:hypothetical protein